MNLSERRQKAKELYLEALKKFNAGETDLAPAYAVHLEMGNKTFDQTLSYLLRDRQLTKDDPFIAPFLFLHIGMVHARLDTTLKMIEGTKNYNPKSAAIPGNIGDISPESQKTQTGVHKSP